MPLIAANRAQDAMGADDNAITLFDARGSHSLGRGPKLEQARDDRLDLAGLGDRFERLAGEEVLHVQAARDRVLGHEVDGRIDRVVVDRSREQRRQVAADERLGLHVVA